MITKRRGRPKKLVPLRDNGTEELQQKRKQHATTELLDWLLQQEWITEDEHQYGVYLRTLYVIRFGVPHAQSLDLAAVLVGDAQYVPLPDQKHERAAKKLRDISEYIRLQDPRYERLLLAICVYGQLPELLRRDIFCRAEVKSAFQALERAIQQERKYNASQIVVSYSH